MSAASNENLNAATIVPVKIPTSTPSKNNRIRKIRRVFGKIFHLREHFINAAAFCKVENCAAAGYNLRGKGGNSMANLIKQKRIKAVREAVENYFEAEGTKYFSFKERNTAQASFATNTRFGHVTIFFRAYMDMLVLHFVIPLKATEEERGKVGEFLLRANYGSRVGGFDMDFDDGKIYYRVTISCGYLEFAPPTNEQINAALSIGIMMVEKYGDGLVKVMFGLAEPEDAIIAAELDD